MSDLAIQELETKFAFLERHVEEQDHIILKLQQTVDLLVKELKLLKEKQDDENHGSSATNEIDVKPPHY